MKDQDRDSAAKLDCRHFRGETPCHYSRFSCEGCGYYDPMGVRILIIKLAAMGDVIRTTPLVEALRARHERCHLSWVVKAPSAPLLEGVPGIDQVLVLDDSRFHYLTQVSFDEVYCLDKEPGAITLSAAITAKKKKGFTLTPGGKLGIFDEDAAYALRLGIDDLLKFLKNRKTYQEIIFEVCSLSFQGEAVRIGISDEERRAGREYLRSLGPGPYIGINTGAGEVFATKRMSREQTARLAIDIRDELEMTPVLLGGESEAERNERIAALAGSELLNAGTHHPVRRFAAIISGLSALVCVDTLAMHLAVAEEVPVIAIFGPTCPQEVHLYGRGEKIISAPWCAPCYKSACDHHSCMRQVENGPIIEALQRLLAKRAGG